MLEAWPILIARDDSVVAEYHFGSEAMIGNGGWFYANPELYAAWMLALGFTGLAVCTLFRKAFLRRSWATAAFGAALPLLYQMAGVCLGDREWERRDTVRRSATSDAERGSGDDSAESSSPDRAARQ